MHFTSNNDVRKLIFRSQEDLFRLDKGSNISILVHTALIVAGVSDARLRGRGPYRVPARNRLRRATNAIVKLRADAMRQNPCAITNKTKRKTQEKAAQAIPA